MSKDKKPYPVGYGKPPPEHRFKKGRSGNPRGRPRKKLDDRPIRERSHGRIIMEIMSMKQTIHIDGIEQKVAYFQAILLSIVKSAVAGKPSAQRLAVQLIQRAITETTEEDMRLLDKLMEIDQSKLDTPEVIALKQSLLDNLDESGLDIDEIEFLAAVDRALRALKDNQQK